jgi:hypothetical protein
VATIGLSFRFPALVAWFVLSFDFYWLYKAVALTSSVLVTFLRIRRVVATDWTARLRRLADLPAGERALTERIAAVQARVARLETEGQRQAGGGLSTSFAMSRTSSAA